MKIPDYCIHNNQTIKGFFGIYRFLSNFWPCDIWFEGYYYPCVECAFQAAKTKDIIQRKQFCSLSASAAKQEGRDLQLRPDWDKVKFEIMTSLVFDKFFRNKELRQQLLDTGDTYLQESNHWGDKIWGVDVRTGQGKNYLGKILMQVRNFWTWTEKKEPIMHFYNEADYYHNIENLCGLNFYPHSIDGSGK